MKRKLLRAIDGGGNQLKNLLITASTWSHICNFHLPYLQEFRRRGWEVHVGCKGIPQNAPCVNKSVELPFEKRMTAFSNFTISRSLRRLIRSEQYDLIITHTSLAAFFTRLAVKGLKTRPKLINVVHGYLFDDRTPLFKRQILLEAERLTAPETDLLLTMNEWDFREAKKYRLGNQIKKIPGMGVDFAKLDAATEGEGIRVRKTLGIPEDAFVLIYPAEFSKRKSQHVLIEAMPYLPENVWLVLCGEGELRNACKALAEKYCVEHRVLFPGQVRNIAPWYRMADALVASSRSEGLPFNVMEAMHIGLPVVASEVKGHVDLIENGKSGLLYPYGDAEKCADSLMLLLNNPNIREKISICGKREARSYSRDTVFTDICGTMIQTM